MSIAKPDLDETPTAVPVTDWGPLQGLIGEWEGDEGVDVAYSHARGEVFTTPYREKASLKPFGPVLNGDQSLMGLDYRAAMWRDDEENPFHTEVGYWLWDPAAGEVVRGFVVPRGITVLAGAAGVAAGASTFTLTADLGNPRYGISQNAYLGRRASSASYTATMTVGEDTWSYEQCTTLHMTEIPGSFSHTDRNRLRRVG